MIQRGRFFSNKGFSLNREAAENRWKDYLRELGDKLATQLDPSYWPGHGGNIEPAVVARANFLKIFDDQSAETLLQTKELIENVVGR
jgi:hypothetical protein